MIWTAALVLAWLAFNWLAPLATLSTASPMSAGRIPQELFALAKKRRVSFYVANLTRGPGFSAWVWPRYIVVLDKAFLATLTPEHTRFVIGHELGHVELGHLRWRWLFVVTGAILLPAVRRRLQGHEREADEFAAKLTGMRREFWDKPLERRNDGEQASTA